MSQTVTVNIDSRKLTFLTKDHFSENQNGIDLITNNYFFEFDKMIESLPENNSFSHFTLFSNYFFALETMFGLLCALAQAPYYFYAWLLNYKTVELYNVVTKIQNNYELSNPHGKQCLDWETISNIIHPKKDTDLDNINNDKYAKIWKRLANDFLNTEFQDAYNSIKHGLRAKQDGIKLIEIGDLKLEGSDYGLKFGKSIKENGQYRIEYKTINFNKEFFKYVFIYAHYTINNIREFLKSVNLTGNVDVFQYFLKTETVDDFLSLKAPSIVSVTFGDN